MRSRILIIVAILLLILAAVSAVSPGAADDDADGRLANLETRVAALETAVAGGATPTNSNSNQQNTSSSSSSSSSSTNATNSFTYSFSGNGDREIEVEIDDAGTYQVTATTSTAFTASLEDGGGEVVPGFPLETDAADTMTVTVALEAGIYTMYVAGNDTWNVSILLTGP